jgi:hypothetical protein
MIGNLLSWWGRPEVLRRTHGCLTVFWVLLWIAAAVFGWLDSVAFVSNLSAVALILGSWSSWQAARAEIAISWQADSSKGVCQDGAHEDVHELPGGEAAGRIRQDGLEGDRSR